MEQVSGRTRVLSKIALFAAAIIWGSSFFVVKNTVDSVPPHFLLAIRFTVGCLLLCAIFFRRLRQIDRGYLISGAVIGLLLFGAYSLQTIGITSTTPGKNAFLTAIYCVLVPFLFWIFNRTRPDRYHFIAAILCITGIGFVSLTETFTIGTGDAFTLAGGVLYAAHIVAVAKLSQNRDPILLTLLQFGAAAIYAFLVAICFETFPTSWTPDCILGILFLAVFATTGALLFQNIGQKYTNPSAASIILSLESVFGVLFSVLFYGERLTARLIIGFALIFVSVIVSETKLRFLHRRTEKPLSK